jgi:hypothetical protein
LFERRLRRIENARKDLLDATPYRTPLIRLMRMKGKARAAFHRSVDFIQRDLTGLSRQPRATTHPFAGGNQPSPTEIGKNAANYHGVGVYAAGKHLGRNGLLLS